MPMEITGVRIQNMEKKNSSMSIDFIVSSTMIGNKLIYTQGIF